MRWRPGFIPEGAAGSAGSYGNHLFRQPVQAIQALAGVREIVALDENLLFF